MEIRSFIKALLDGQHPPRIYKPSGVNPSFPPYEELGLHHHHLHRDGNPLLVTQHVEGDIYGIALAMHQTFFQEDKMQWLKDNAVAIDWRSSPLLHQKVINYDPAVSAKSPAPEHKTPDAGDEAAPSDDDVPF
jgi:hypothetical protein